LEKSEVTTEEVTAPAAPSAVFKENGEVVVAQASATDTRESAPQFLDPGAESSAETPAAAESTETAKNTETTEVAFGTPTEGATGGVIETTETLTLDELSPASIAEIIEAIEASTGTEVLTSDADISVADSSVAETSVPETSVAEVASEGESETGVTAFEVEGVDEEPEAAIEAPDVDGYAVYIPASDSAPVSEPMSLAA